ncbi:hypothetical protein GQ44DRAFT_682306 [Phaeosphaeriaceae sp. PMI808]|nr:hypothetical protein GQ44DRAFT_682306 [Phaeosphaeriaceae sp. PMI808]
MDDHHHQPIWPMLQGAANYGWNLIEEAWSMVWKPVNATSYHAVKREKRLFQQNKCEMQEGQYDRKVACTSNSGARTT